MNAERAHGGATRSSARGARGCACGRWCRCTSSVSARRSASSRALAATRGRSRSSRTRPRRSARATTRAPGGRRGRRRRASASSRRRTSAPGATAARSSTSRRTCAARVRRLRAHGAVAPYVHAELGRNSRLDALQAAVLLGQGARTSPRGRRRARASRALRERSSRGCRCVLPPRPRPPGGARVARVRRPDARAATRSRAALRERGHRGARLLPGAASPAAVLRRARRAGLPGGRGRLPRRRSRCPIGAGASARGQQALVIETDCRAFFAARLLTLLASRGCSGRPSSSAHDFEVLARDVGPRAGRLELEVLLPVRPRAAALAELLRAPSPG